MKIAEALPNGKALILLLFVLRLLYAPRGVKPKRRKRKHISQDGAASTAGVLPLASCRPQALARGDDLVGRRHHAVASCQNVIFQRSAPTRIATGQGTFRDQREIFIGSLTASKVSNSEL